MKTGPWREEAGGGFVGLVSDHLHALWFVFSYSVQFLYALTPLPVNDKLSLTLFLHYALSRPLRYTTILSRTGPFREVSTIYIYDLHSMPFSPPTNTSRFASLTARFDFCFTHCFFAARGLERHGPVGLPRRSPRADGPRHRPLQALFLQVRLRGRRSRRRPYCLQQLHDL